MSDAVTDQAEVAKLISNDEQYRTYVVLSLQDLKARVYSLERKQVTVSSSVNDYEENKQQFKGAWKALGLIVSVGLVLAGGLGWIWDHVIAIFTTKGHP